MIIFFAQFAPLSAFQAQAHHHQSLVAAGRRWSASLADAWLSDTVFAAEITFPVQIVADSLEYIRIGLEILAEISPARDTKCRVGCVVTWCIINFSLDI